MIHLSMTSKTFLAGGVLAIFALVVLIPQVASAEKEFDTDVSVWDSSVAIDSSTGIFPVGGSGQIAGNFAVDTYTKKHTAIEVGLRAQERFVGPITPFGGTYFAQSGESAPDRTKWNFDWSLDFGSEFLEAKLGKELTPLNMEDFSVILEISDFKGNSWTFDFGDFPNDDGPIVLNQNSWNIGFGFIDIPLDSETYDVTLSVSNEKGKTLAESQIWIIINEDGVGTIDDVPFPFCDDKTLKKSSKVIEAKKLLGIAQSNVNSKLAALNDVMSEEPLDIKKAKDALKDLKKALNGLEKAEKKLDKKIGKYNKEFAKVC